jgi:hypothetical protein
LRTAIVAAALANCLIKAVRLIATPSSLPGAYIHAVLKDALHLRLDIPYNFGTGSYLPGFNQI